MNPFTLNLPTELQIGVERMARLSDKNRSTLAQAIQQVQPALGEAALAEQIPPVAETMDEEDVRLMVWTLLQLSTGSDAMGMSPNRFAELVVDSLEVSEDDKPDGFARWLGGVLESRAVVLSAKAMNVFLDHDHTFSQARILTDVRAVWKDGADSDPEVGVIYHLLKLIYREGRHTQQIFLAMDSNDLQLLKDAVERAQTKERTLQHWLGQKGVNLLSAPRLADEEQEA